MEKTQCLETQTLSLFPRHAPINSGLRVTKCDKGAYFTWATLTRYDTLCSFRRYSVHK